MIDLNVVAEGNLAKLLALEAERAGLTYKVTARPISGARIYVADVTACDTNSLPADSTIAIGEACGFPHKLSNPFLLEDFRALTAKVLAEKPCVKASRAIQKRRSSNIELDRENSSAVMYGEKIPLSPTEFALLDALVSCRGEVLDYESAREIIGGCESNKLNVYICFLRKKLEAGGEKIIYSIRGKGFMIK